MNEWKDNLPDIDEIQNWLDSQIMDFCEENTIPIREFYQFMYEQNAKGTPCEGCVHIALKGSGMYPCNLCSRCKKDLFKPRNSECQHENYKIIDLEKG